MGAINFDIGLIAVPKEILNKETPLNDSEKKLLHQHTVWGYMMLSENSVIPATSSIIALSHHEHQNGTGYPRAQKGENRPPLKANAKSGLIHRFAEIVAVADVYDMLTNGRKHFAAKLEPRKAFQKIIEMRGTVLNSEIVKTFMSTVPVYPVGTRVKIVKAPFANLDGCYAVISKIDPDNIMEPQILVIETKLKNKMTKPITIDLSKNKGFELELAS